MWAVLFLLQKLLVVAVLVPDFGDICSQSPRASTHDRALSHRACTCSRSASCQTRCQSVGAPGVPPQLPGAGPPLRPSDLCGRCDTAPRGVSIRTPLVTPAGEHADRPPSALRSPPRETAAAPALAPEDAAFLLPLLIAKAQTAHVTPQAGRGAPGVRSKGWPRPRGLPILSILSGNVS